MNSPKIAFQLEKIHLPLGQILPIRQLDNPRDRIARYRTILSSIEKNGLVEPLVVYPEKRKGGSYLLMDGHLRYFALKELKHENVECVIANDDESFTYNARINRLSPIQEHQMIAKAVKNGVSIERIASVLNLDKRYVTASVNLLKGIHPEAAELLKDKPIGIKAIWILKRVVPDRQIEIVELMTIANNFTEEYAKALLLGTPHDQLIHSEKPKVKSTLSAEEMARMQQEMETLERDFKAVEDSYGENVLNVTLARAYVKKLLENVKVVRYLKINHQDVLAEFETIVTSEVL